jgi:hypothetical protein
LIWTNKAQCLLQPKKDRTQSSEFGIMQQQDALPWSLCQ